jgi:hypothetical protein
MPIDTSRYEKAVRYEVTLDNGEDYTRWSDLVLGTADNISESTRHISGSKSVKFDKAAGSTKVYIYKTFNNGIDLGLFANEGYVCASVYIPDSTNVQKIFVGFIGDNLTDTLLFEETTVETGWNHVRLACSDGAQDANGVNWESIKSVFVGLQFAASGNTLSNICVDSVRIQMVSTSGGSSSVSGDVGLSDLSAANTARTASTNVLAVQHIDASGNVLPAGSSVSSAIYTQDIGGGAAGGGNFLYTSPEDFTASFTSSSGVVLTGLSYTPAIEQFCSVKAINSSGHASNYTPTTNDFDFDSGTGVLNIGGASFSATDQGYAVSIYGPDKAYDKAYDANNVILTNPEHSWVVGSTLVSGTGVTDGIYYYYYDMNTYDIASFQINLQSSTTTTSGIITATCEATVQDDGVPYTACRYEDVTYGLFKVYQIAATGGVSNSTIWSLNQPAPFRYLRVKVNASSGGSNNCAYSVFARKAFS